MNPRTPVETLTDEEAAWVKALAAEQSPDGAAKELGLNRITVANAAAGFPVHRTTVRLVRLRFAAARAKAI